MKTQHARMQLSLEQRIIWTECQKSPQWMVRLLFLAYCDNALATQALDMMADGHDWQELRVNDGQDAWGADCVTTTDELEELCGDWHRDGTDDGATPDDLPDIDRWLHLMLG